MAAKLDLASGAEAVTGEAGTALDVVAVEAPVADEVPLADEDKLSVFQPSE